MNSIIVVCFLALFSVTQAASKGPGQQTTTRCTPTDWSWSDWHEWTPCSITCYHPTPIQGQKKVQQIGKQFRTRYCFKQRYGGKSCSKNKEIDFKDCTGDKKCPINGGWGQWKATDCSKTCGHGTQIFTRNCDRPKPQYCGFKCPGNAKETHPCFIKHCPDDCEWSDWETVGKCSKTCCQGLQQYKRIRKPKEKHGGKPCTGHEIKYEPCNVKTPCPVDCVVSVWKKHGRCDMKACKQEERRYIVTAPKYKGKACPRDRRRAVNCAKSCFDCQYTYWKKITPCSKTCGNGIRQETRRVKRKEIGGGKKCTGPLRKISACKNKIKCVCEKPCTKILNQVCGTDGKTYANKCLLDNAKCNNKNLRSRNEGPCAKKG